LLKGGDMLAENRAARMLIIIPVFALLLALTFSVAGVQLGADRTSVQAGPRAFIQASVSLTDAFYATVSGAQALLAQRK
jgi:hypothetical protein